MYFMSPKITTKSTSRRTRTSRIASMSLPPKWQSSANTLSKSSNANRGKERIMAATLDWLGCATFRLTLSDLVVFLDAYIDRVPGAAPTGITVDEITRADWIVVGHSHFDHLYGAERIAKATGATIIGSYETVRVMETMGVPPNQLMPVAGGERIRLAKDVIVRVYPSQHSCVWTTPPMPASDQVCLGDLGALYQERQERLQELWNRLQSAGAELLSH